MVVLSPNTIFMNGKSSQSGKQRDNGAKSGSSAKGAILLGVLGVAALLVAIAVFNSGSPARSSGDGAKKTPGQVADVSTPGADSEKPKIIGTTGPGDSEAPKEATPKQVVSEIVSIASLTNEVTHEQAEKFKADLTELIRQGPASVPAIQDYLDKNLDSNYGDVKGAEELGYNSLRHAMVDTLKQIGGPEAEGAMAHVLQTTAEPNEVAELAKNLEQMAPGQYRDQALQAATEALNMAYNGQLGSNIERGPLFRVFQIYGANYAPPTAPATATQ